MGRGRSGKQTALGASTPSSTRAREISDESMMRWNEAFTVRGDQVADWEKFTEPWQVGVTDQNLKAIMAQGWQFGYVRTSHSFEINAMLYKPENAGKSLEEIFTKTDSNGVKRDLQTVQTLDKLIRNHGTPNNAFYTRFTDSKAIKSLYGLTDEQMQMFSWGSGSPANAAMINNVLAGKESYSRSFTSASANASFNVFTHKQFERRIYVPQGTPSFGVKSQSDESEVIFGRNVNTRLMKVTWENGHYVLHERFTGYKEH